MPSSRSRRTSGLAVILGGLRRGLVIGVLIALALRADLPKRLLELYQSLTGATATGGRAGVPPATDRGDSGSTADSGVTAAVVGTEVESGDVGVDNVRRAETGIAGEEGNEEAAALDVEPGASTEASAAAAYDDVAADTNDVEAATLNVEPGASTDAAGVAGYQDDQRAGRGPATEPAADASAASTEASGAAGYEAPESDGDGADVAEAEPAAVTTDDEDAAPVGSPDLDLAAVTDVRDEDEVAPGLADADVDAIDIEADLPDPDADLIEDEPPILDGEGGDAGEDGPTNLGTDVTGTAPAGQGREQPVPHIATDVEDAVPGDGTTTCPEGFPVKGNNRSRLYHVPGGISYERTKAEVCFRSPEAAERAGYQAAKS